MSNEAPGANSNAASKAIDTIGTAHSPKPGSGKSSGLPEEE